MQTVASNDSSEIDVKVETIIESLQRDARAYMLHASERGLAVLHLLTNALGTMPEVPVEADILTCEILQSFYNGIGRTIGSVSVFASPETRDALIECATN